MACRPPKPHPRRPQHHHLASRRVHIPILHTTKRPSTQPRTRDDRINSLGGLACEHRRAAFCDLANVLNGGTEDGSTAGEETAEEVIAVYGSVDGDGCEGAAGLGVLDEVGF